MRTWNRTQAEHARAERLKTWNIILGVALACSALIIVAQWLAAGK